jgi:hypothetical protein
VAVAGAPRRVAVIDIGSNSARAVAYGLDTAGQLPILARSRAALHHMCNVDRGHRLGPKAVNGVAKTRWEFRALEERPERAGDARPLFAKGVGEGRAAFGSDPGRDVRRPRARVSSQAGAGIPATDN